MKKLMFMKFTLLAFLTLQLSCGKPEASLNLNGQWESDCIVDTEADFYEMKYQITINKGTIEITQELFGRENEDCSQKSDIVKRFHHYRQENSTLHIESAYFSSLVFYDENFISVFNNMSLCGFNDWEKGVEKETTNQTCPEGFDFSQPYSLTALKGNKVLTLKDSYGDVIHLKEIKP